MLDRGSSPVARRRHRDLQEPYRHPAPRLPSIQATRQEGRPHCRPSFRPIPHDSGRRPMAGFPRLSLRAFCREPRTGTGLGRGSGVGLAGKIGCALPVLLGEPGMGSKAGRGYDCGAVCLPPASAASGSCPHSRRGVATARTHAARVSSSPPPRRGSRGRPGPLELSSAGGSCETVARELPGLVPEHRSREEDGCPRVEKRTLLRKRQEQEEASAAEGFRERRGAAPGTGTPGDRAELNPRGRGIRLGGARAPLSRPPYSPPSCR